MAKDKKYTGVYALVDAETVARLRPVIDEMVEVLDEAATPQQRKVMHGSGWSFEMFAWGKVIDVAAAEELEILVDPEAEDQEVTVQP